LFYYLWWQVLSSGLFLTAASAKKEKTNANETPLLVPKAIRPPGMVLAVFVVGIRD
jgi:hypothetical protein